MYHLTEPSRARINCCCQHSPVAQNAVETRIKTLLHAHFLRARARSSVGLVCGVGEKEGGSSLLSAYWFQSTYTFPIWQDKLFEPFVMFLRPFQWHRHSTISRTLTRARTSTHTHTHLRTRIFLNKLPSRTMWNLRKFFYATKSTVNYCDERQTTVRNNNNKYKRKVPSI